MKKLAIKAENISKQYRLGEVGTGTISHDLNRFWHKLRGNEDPYLKIGDSNDRTSKGNSDYVWSLRDINFEVEQGDAVGIIGRNGAGKSTLLKLLSKVTKPTTGSFKVNGRIASLLEVGTGFNPEMTGRENIYLNGAILGMRKAEITRKLDEIIAFSGVERYIDTPVKRYSSGMYVRLAFAVAAHLESEILIVDEVLAVGDAEFQKKCLGKMSDVSKGEGRTVLFVSHNMSAIEALCNKTMMLENGRVLAEGKTKDIIAMYFKSNSREEGLFKVGKVDKNEVVVINQSKLINEKGVVTNNFEFGDSITVEVELESSEIIQTPYLWIMVKSMSGPLFAATGMLDGFRPQFLKEGKNTIKCTFFNPQLLPGTYYFHMGIRAADGLSLLTKSKDIASFNVLGSVVDKGLNGTLADSLANDAISPLVPYQWEFENGQIYNFNTK
ncbi:MAG TPA: ABC transporter ATP-binding protein [Flavobacterium sp.]|uniref:ABC transporter ATP-binding protein n=1 Tax=Flavobacterium sp. TaxID=239 RepID=UPI002BB5CBB5|nr:ABC transporter ATP-binding protein [Flavobacterium sp.]HNP33341.1 ABC transporter ATP-binding protein [Flavobacterium sp.]